MATRLSARYAAFWCWCYARATKEAGVGMSDSASTDSEADQTQKLITACPKCGNEQFEVVVNTSGSYPDEWGTCHWYEGNGICHECGHKGAHSDSSH